MAYTYPQVITYKKILHGLLVLNLLFGAYLLFYGFTTSDSDSTMMFLSLIGVSVSVFHLVLLITLINYVEYLDTRLGRLQDYLNRLEEGPSPVKWSEPPYADSSSPVRSRGNLSDRIGRL